MENPRLGFSKRHKPSVVLINVKLPDHPVNGPAAVFCKKKFSGAYAPGEALLIFLLKRFHLLWKARRGAAPFTPAIFREKLSKAFHLAIRNF